MTRSIVSGTVSAIACIAIALTVTSLPTNAQRPAATATVSIADIGTRVKIVGKLGIPLEDMAIVRGVWEGPGEFATWKAAPKHVFRVTHVNGVALMPTVTFWDEQFSQVARIREQGPKYESVEGSVWEFRACETARFAGADAHMSEFTDVPVATRGHAAGTLQSSLLVVKQSIRSVPESKAKGQ